MDFQVLVPFVPNFENSGSIFKEQQQEIMDPSLPSFGSTEFAVYKSLDDTRPMFNEVAQEHCVMAADQGRHDRIGTTPELVLPHRISPLSGFETPLLPTMQDAYQQLDLIGRGGYGAVFRGRNRVTGEEVALKMVLMDNPLSLFEAECLDICRHPSIIELKEIMLDRQNNKILFLVMELAQGGDLAFLTECLKQQQLVLEEHLIRQFIFELLQGVAQLHHKGFIHGDLKTDNLLLTHDSKLKICDMGLSQRCIFSNAYQKANYSRTVGTRWYLPPELLLSNEGAITENYSAAIDLWAVGCILAELVCLEPLFPGNSHSDQLSQIVKLLGFPWDQCFDKLYQRLLPGSLSTEGFDLLTKLLDYNDDRRITAESALHHPWFQSNNSACQSASQPGCIF